MGNRRETRLRFTFKQDVTEPGNIDFFKLNPITERIESYRNYLTNRVDSMMQWQTEFSFRALRHGQVFFTLSNEHRNPTYAYQYLPKGDVAASQQEFTMSEVGIGIRYAYGEKYTQFGRGKAVMTPAFPVISVAVARGIPNFLGSSPDLDFTKLNIKIEEKFLWRTLGTTTFQLFAGKIWGDLPYPYLQNFRGSSSKGGIFVENYFQTMGIYEFTADQHASLFFTHNFGALLFKSKVDWFKPELMLVQNIGFGSLNNQKNHQIADLQTLDKGFYESGMVINNLWLRKFIGFKQGFGLGVFRRYGNYSLAEGIQNWSFKLTNTFSF